MKQIRILNAFTLCFILIRGIWTYQIDLETIKVDHLFIRN